MENTRIANIRNMIPAFDHPDDWQNIISDRVRITLIGFPDPKTLRPGDEREFWNVELIDYIISRVSHHRINTPKMIRMGRVLENEPREGIDMQFA